MHGAGEDLSYSFEDVKLQGLYFSGSRRSGAVLFPGGMGVDAHTLERGERLAEMGYHVLVADYHGERPASVEAALAIARALRAEPRLTRGRGSAALAALMRKAEIAESNISTVGFCLGGTVALELARSGAAIRVAASFHGELGTLQPAEKGALTATVLAYVGGIDPTTPETQRNAFLAEMETANARASLTIYSGTRHAFTNPQTAASASSAYHPENSKAAWLSFTLTLEDAHRDL